MVDFEAVPGKGGFVKCGRGTRVENGFEVGVVEGEDGKKRQKVVDHFNIAS